MGPFFGTDFERNERRRLGPLVSIASPDAGITATLPGTINGTVRVIGPLKKGSYSLEADADCYVLAGTKDQMFPSGAVCSSALVQTGVKVPANSEIGFAVGDNDGYIGWVNRGSSAGSDFRINDRTAGKSA